MALIKADDLTFIDELDEIVGKPKSISKKKKRKKKKKKDGKKSKKIKKLKEKNKKIKKKHHKEKHKKKSSKKSKKKKKNKILVLNSDGTLNKEKSEILTQLDYLSAKGNFKYSDPLLNKILADDKPKSIWEEALPMIILGGIKIVTTFLSNV